MHVNKKPFLRVVFVNHNPKMTLKILKTLNNRLFFSELYVANFKIFSLDEMGYKMSQRGIQNGKKRKKTM